MKKVFLMILDGWGIGDGSQSDAIAHAQTPFFDSLMIKYPHGKLLTSGEQVGLPQGQMGNSEVGHLNIGAGRIVYQDLARINKEVREGAFQKLSVFTDAFTYAKTQNKQVHLMGLVSEGGVHSSQAHLHALCDMAKDAGLQKVFVHAFLDGRDTDPKSGWTYLNNLSNHIKEGPVKIASVIGRYYAMDRDKRWERVKKAYDLFVHGIGTPTREPLESLQQSYAKQVTDEFVEPLVCVNEQQQALATIQPGDVVICFNFRTDRCREITQVLTQQAFEELEMHPLDLYYVTMTNYDATFKNVKVAYNKDNLALTLGEVISLAGKRQIRIAETEKYPHVTFFFSGGREQTFEEERRILIPSPKVATYDLQPEMSAHELTDAILPELKPDGCEFICLNFANPDMVGHTGVYKAVIKAVETVDTCMKQLVEAGLAAGYSFIIIADHGNSDFMVNPDGSPNTAHSTNPVPCIIIDDAVQQIKDGILADVAPTVLRLLQIPQPEQMTGVSLV